MPPGQNGILGTTEGTIFCSESCFSQSRRASFKRAKTCDWCRHVRHAVSYVDFQDGVTQLQFCSDKCLNQYKMQIFCNETQAHLDMNPHLKEKCASTGTFYSELSLKSSRYLFNLCIRCLAIGSKNTTLIMAAWFQQINTCLPNCSIANLFQAAS